MAGITLIPEKDLKSRKNRMGEKACRTPARKGKERMEHGKRGR